MKISKELKYAKFEWDDEEKIFTLWSDEKENGLKLNKVYAFAFMRFVIRMAQRNWYRKITKKENQTLGDLPELDEDSVNQLALCLEDVAKEEKLPWDDLPF